MTKASASAILVMVVMTLTGCPEAPRAPTASVVEIDPTTTAPPIAITASAAPAVRDHEILDRRTNDVYRWVELGPHRWLAENLRFPSENSWCYEDDPSNCTRYGRLYAWAAAMEACPSGWHLPTEDEWEEPLHVALQMERLMDGKGAGFDILFAGWRDGRSGEFKELTTNFYFWSATEYDGDKDRARLRWNLSPSDLQIATDVKTHGYSVRCVAN